MKKFAYIPTHYPKTISTVSLLLVLISLFLATHLKLSHYPLEWFPKDDPNYIGTHYIDDKMKETLTMEMVIDTKKENGWQDPVRLAKLDKLSSELEGYNEEIVLTLKEYFGTDMILIALTKYRSRVSDKLYQTVNRYFDHSLSVA